MFKIEKCGTINYRIKNQHDDYLHSDGNIYRTCEYWPSKELAQVVLDKYQPLYVWKHGDVAITRNEGQRIFIRAGGKLRIYDGIGQMFTDSANIQQWAKDFGYKKIGNVFGL